MSDSIILFESEGRCIWFKLKELCMEMAVQDLGGSTYLMNGTDTYEFWYSVEGENATKLWNRLRGECVGNQTVQERVKELFGCENGPVLFKEYCEEIGVKPKFASF